MNSYFNYPGRELWYDDAWARSISPIQPLVDWIGTLDDTELRDYQVPEKYKNIDVSGLPEYNAASEAVEDPEVLARWRKQGMYFTSRCCAGMMWLALVPENLSMSDKRKTILVFHTVDYASPFWAMDTMLRYGWLNDLAAKEKHIVLYIVTNGPEKQGVFPNILQEAFDLFAADVNRFYLDLSVIGRRGKKLSDAPAFSYTDRAGRRVEDPDAAVEKLGDHPVLDISKRWEVCNSIVRNVIWKYKFNEGACNKERLSHSPMGKMLAEGLTMEHEWRDALSPEFMAYFDKMGLVYEQHLTGGRRWLTMVPRQQLETKEKLPLVILFHEVNLADDRLPMNAVSYHTTRYCEIAATGDCMLLWFACERADDNELLVDILREAEEKYPVDTSRVYITGHSHNGRFALEFTARHPGLITAVAQLGNTSGHMHPSVSTDPDDVVMTDEKLEVLRAHDIPFIVEGGVPEVASPLRVKTRKPMTEEDFAAAWQRRLYSCNCPPKTVEEIRAASDSTDKATRILGIPNDHSETFYADGYEHYIIDIDNAQGKRRIRVVGIEDTPHMVTPMMQTLSWSFLRSYKKDEKTQKIVNLDQ